jgi:hypothetical protein
MAITQAVSFLKHVTGFSYMAAFYFLNNDCE